MNRRQFRTDFGFRGLGFVFDEAEFTVRYADYDQDEIETFEASGEEIVATHFDNRSVVFRGELRKPSGRVHSRVGVWGNVRDYEAWGHEALAPETRQNAFAAFTYNEIEANERLDVLLGARAERNAYDVGKTRTRSGRPRSWTAPSSPRRRAPAPGSRWAAPPPWSEWRASRPAPPRSRSSTTSAPTSGTWRTRSAIPTSTRNGRWDST